MTRRPIAAIVVAGIVVGGMTGPAFAAGAQTGQADGVVSRVSVSSRGVQGNHESYEQSVSGNGRYVAFHSRASNLVPGDTPGSDDVFVRDRHRGRTTRVSAGGSPAISADGRYVAFEGRGIDVHDRKTGRTTRVDVSSRGTAGNNESHSPAISGDGRYVAFYSAASNLVPGDTDGIFDVFVHDRRTGKTSRASVSSTGAQLHGDSWQAAISSDGRYVGFETEANDVVPGDTNGVSDAFVRDRVAHTTVRLSLFPGGVEGNDWSERPSLSADGRYAAFYTAATNLVPGDTTEGHLVVRDMRSGTIRMLAAASSPSFSADGRYLAYESWAPQLVPAGGNGVFVRDLATGRTRAVVVRPESRGMAPQISADGHHVVLQSDLPLTPGDTNRRLDVFVWDRQR
jgi:Tol biopolymer transport system component